MTCSQLDLAALRAMLDLWTSKLKVAGLIPSRGQVHVD